jgi:chemotaxis protein MotB
LAALLGGCVTLDDHDRIKAQNRNLAAQKEALGQELFDCRTANDSLRTRTAALDRELETKNELLANLRSENEILDDMRKMALTELEKAAGRTTLGDITIAGPKLPERLDSAIKQFASQHPSLVEYDAARGSIKWKADLLFPLGSDVVKESSLEALQAFSEVIKSPAAAEFETLVVGHTDNRPIVRPETKEQHATNWHLSAHRAISVSQSLSRFGYAPARIGVMGYGEFRPIAPNTTEQGAAQNRRVEVYLVPRGSIVQASARDAGNAAVSMVQP